MTLNHAPISVLLIDDNLEFRRGLNTLLSFCGLGSPRPIRVVGQAASVDQALQLIQQQRPNLLLLDLELGQELGETVLLQAAEVQYEGKTLILSAHHEDEWIFRAMRAGAHGYVLKDQVASQLCEAIQTVLKDQVYLPPEVATRFFSLFHFYAGRSLQAARSTNLTDRELEVLHWLVQGSTNEAIAGHLYITVATVKAHLTAIFEKLGVKNRTQAIIKALKLGLVTA